MMPISNTEATLESADNLALSPAKEKSTVSTVFLQHPHRPDEDPIEVENTGEALTPYMVTGYQQVRSQSK
jgi:hypothetical protein